MILLIDNYDSFTFNLKQAIESLGGLCEVHRNDEISIQDIERMRPSAIVISPGPGNPDQAGISLEVIRRFSGRLPILGVCLGHQALGQVFGGKVVRAPRVRHGKISKITHQRQGLFRGLENPLRATRYHSLMIDPKTLPECLVVDAVSEDGVIMSVRHRNFPVFGVQFHPESVATERGERILLNFLELEGASVVGQTA